MKKMKKGFKQKIHRLLLLGGFMLMLSMSAWSQSIFLGTDVLTGAQCNCLNNATTLMNGQFQDTITVVSATGETWTVVNPTVGAFSAISLAPPGTPISVLGETFTEVSSGVYQLIIRHVDALGFAIFVNNGTVTLDIDNSCFYPTIAITGLADTVCLTSAPVPLMADNNGVNGFGAFTIDGQAAVIFNAQLLGEGDYTVRYTFDAGTGTPGDSTDPGCIAWVEQEVAVPPQPNTAVIAFVNVTLGEDCEAVITPGMVMSGIYPCLDDFIVSVFDQFGANIGNTVNGNHAGQQLNVRVMSEAGLFIGDGAINITDDYPPILTCLPNTNRVDVANDIQLLTGTITNTALSFMPNNFSCYNASVEPMSGSHFYTLQEINVTRTDYYTIELSHTATNGGVFGVYQGAFNPFQGPCQGNVGVSEALPLGEGYYSTLGNVTRLHVMLTPDMPYTLLTTTFDGNEFGDYEYAFYSEGNGEVVGLNSFSIDISLPLFCSIVPSLVDNPASLDLLGRPIVDDACNLNPAVTFTDEYTATGHCSIGVLERTFRVVDQSGNAAECTQTIEFPIITLTDVNLPPKTANISCDETYEVDDEGHPSPTETGYPFVVSADGTHNIDPVYCNMLANYEDLPEVQECTGTFSFIRRWVVFDNCNPGNIIEYDQLIIVGDRTGPLIECIAPDADMNGLPDTLVYSASGSNCAAALQAPMPIVIDNCSGWQVLTELITDQLVPITNPFGTIIGYDTVTVVLATIPHSGNRLITNIPLGVHHFRYTATDDCWNMSVTQCPIRVIDSGAPTAACDDLIHVSLGGNGLGVIMAEDIDEGSSDVCGPVVLQIRRTMDFNPDDCSASPLITTDWGPSVDLFCCEAGSTITVDLLVTDLNGIFNTCSTTVSIDDTTSPICVAPSPVFTNCSAIPPGTDFDDIDMLQSLYGMAEVIDACHGTTVTELTPDVDMSSCGLGTILRHFEVEDIAGNTSSCQQLINLTVYVDYEIKFPKDVTGECEEPGPDTLIINKNGCSEIDIVIDDEFLGAALDACYKILRTYTVTNWCEYDGFSPAVVVDRNIACLPNRGTQDIWVIRRSDGTVYLDLDNDETNGIPAAGIRSTICDGNSNPSGYWMNAISSGRWSYTQMITVTDTSMPVITAATPDPFCSFTDNCEGSGAINFSVSDGGCSANLPTITVAIDLNTNGQFTTPATLTGTFPDYQVSGTFPTGSHRLRITVEDVCENTSVEFVDFSVVDCIAAGLICNTSIAQVLMVQPAGVDADGDGDVDAAAAAVNVNLFINSTGTDCSGPFRFTIHRILDLDTGADIAFPNHPALVVTCDDIGFIPVRIYLWDNAFNPYSIQPDGTVGGPNYTTCDALLDVQAPLNDVCSTVIAMGSVSGLILTEEGEPVSGVEISPRDDMMEDMLMTENDGLYSFDLATQEAYHITPYSQNDYLNGVSTFDIVLISKHILGVTPIESPYKLIAADINRSSTISTLDLVHLRKAILGITDGFTSNESWRFINAAFEFPDPNDPWLEPFPESMPISSLGANVNGIDFIAVKIGDINGNVTANLGETGDDRSVDDIYYLRTDDHAFEGGEIVEAIFSSADEMDDVQGFQFTLQFETNVLELEDIEWGQIQPEHVNTSRTESGIITVSWNENTRSSDFEQSGLTFFTVRFRTLNKGRLSESIGLTSRVTRAEAYGFDDSMRGIALNFITKKEGTNEFFLEQNRPNPFGDQTIIGFQIPESGTVTLTIYDTNGKTVHQYQQYYAAGYNQIMIDAKEIHARGLLYYKLETEQYAATKKMVIIE